MKSRSGGSGTGCEHFAHSPGQEYSQRTLPVAGSWALTLPALTERSWRTLANGARLPGRFARILAQGQQRGVVDVAAAHDHQIVDDQGRRALAPDQVGKLV